MQPILSAAVCWAVLVDPTGHVWEVRKHSGALVKSKITIRVGTSKLLQMHHSADATMFVCTAPDGSDRWAGRFKLVGAKLVLERTPPLPALKEEVVCASLPYRVLVQSSQSVDLLDWRHGRWNRTHISRVDRDRQGRVGAAFNRAGTVFCMSFNVWAIMDSSEQEVLVVGVGSHKPVIYSRCTTHMGAALFTVGNAWQVFGFNGGVRIGGPPGYLCEGHTQDLPHSHPIPGVPRIEPARWKKGYVVWKGDTYGKPPTDSEGTGQLCFSPLGGAICVDLDKSAVNINGREIPFPIAKSAQVLLVQP